MRRKSTLYRLITLLLCLMLAFVTPITVFAENEETVECESSEQETESASEEESEPASEQESEPASEPAAEPATEPASEPVSEPAIPSEPSPAPETKEEEPASEPAIEPATEPAIEPATEPVIEPEGEQPATEPASYDADNAQTGSFASEYTPVQGSAPAGSYTNAQKVVSNVPDAEKFLEEGYDANLCWAATAANMIWTSGYGGEGTNPLTDAPFQNEDEVFDYFRKCFTDEAGDPSAAIEYFITGTYRAQGITGVSQKKDDAPAGKVVSGFDSIPNNSLTFYDQTEHGNSILEVVGDIAGKAVGAWIRFWNSDQNAFDTSAHWATLYDVVKDTANNIIGVLLIDSDNDTVVKENYTNEQKEVFFAMSEEDKARNAKNQPNTYTYYELIDPDEPGITETYRVLKNYVSGAKSLLAGLYVLDIIPLSGGPDSNDIDDDEDIPVTNNNTTSVNTDESDSDKQEHQEHNATVVTISPEQQIPTVLNLNDPAVVEAIFNSIKDMMIKANIDIYSPTGTVYDKNSGTGSDVVIRRLYTSLANIYVNGKRLPGNGKYYKITKLPNGLFIITFTDEYLKLLGDGEHSIRMDFVGSGDLNTTITVK